MENDINYENLIDDVTEAIKKFNLVILLVQEFQLLKDIQIGTIILNILLSIGKDKFYR